MGCHWRSITCWTHPGEPRQAPTGASRSGSSSASPHPTKVAIATHARTAVQLEPERASYHDTLAEVHFQRGDKDSHGIVVQTTTVDVTIRNNDIHHNVITDNARGARRAMEHLAELGVDVYS